MLRMQEKAQEQTVMQMLRQVQCELVTRFDKEEKESKDFIDKAQLMEHLKRHPIALHDSPYHLARGVLLKNKDFQTIKSHE